MKVDVSPGVIRWLRESAGISQEEASKCLGVSLENYRRIEEGKLQPTFSQIEKLSELFRAPTALFLVPRPMKSLVRSKTTLYLNIWLKEVLEEREFNSGLIFYSSCIIRVEE